MFIVKVSGDINGTEQKGLLASRQDIVYEYGVVQRVSSKAGACFHTHTVDWDSLSGYGPMISANRPLRTRMMGGVGAGG